MELSNVEEVLKQAAKAVEGLPEVLQGRAFELAVSMLTGQLARQQTAPAPGPRGGEFIGQHIVPMRDGGLPELSDLLRACKRNPDRYLVFLRDLEVAGEQSDTSTIAERFRKYKQDTPKLPSRDLGDMAAKGLIEQVGKGRDATFVLKRKGRERLAQLDAATYAE